MTQDLFKSELERLSANIPFLPKDTPVFQYVQWLNRLAEEKDSRFLSDYQSIVTQAEETNVRKPFLSVITRTQGNRPEMLKETLQCLAEQTDSDFEVLLIGHKMDDEKKRTVREIIDTFPHAFAQRIRFLYLDHGNRTTPLNFAFAHAHGQYAAALDDDDLVFDDWVMQFHTAANRTPGKIIHSYAYAQSWKAVKDETNQSLKLYPTSEYDPKYCIDYSLLSQIEDNHCPLMTLAFPTVYFKKLGIIFDETLTTSEDWDYFMRLSFICGVEDVPKATAIYRLWENTDNSASMHQVEEWHQNIEHIQNKFLNMPILIPQGQAKRHVRIIDNTQPIPPLRTLIKDRIHNFIPESVWNVLKKIYHVIRGKK